MKLKIFSTIKTIFFVTYALLFMTQAMFANQPYDLVTLSNDFEQLCSRLACFYNNNSDTQYMTVTSDIAHLLMECRHFLRAEGQEVSEGLDKCCACLEDHQATLDVVDLHHALPDLIKYVSGLSSRAPRPTGPLNVVGNNFCDLGVLLSLLQKIDCDINGLVCNDIINTVTACCEDLSITITLDFAATWTILNDISATLTTIINTVTACCEDLSTTITLDFAATWTILNDINATLTTCCSVLETLTTNCAHTPISAAITITSPGAYCLSNDIDGTIIIDSDDVDLDLNGYCISGGTNGVVIDADFSRIRIHNGIINNTSDAAVLVNGGATAVVLENLTITDAGSAAGVFAINFQGSDPITACRISNVLINSCGSGIQLLATNDTQVTNCTITNCTPTEQVTGINIDAGDATAINNQLINVTISSLTAGSGPAVGIMITNASNTLIQNAFVTSISGSTDAQAFNIDCSEVTLIYNSTISTIVATTSAPGTVAGVIVNQSAQTTVQGVTIDNIAAQIITGAISRGIQIVVSPQTIVKDVVVQSVSGGDAGGIDIQSSSDGTDVITSIVEGITGGLLSCVGINVQSDNTSCYGCNVEDINLTLTGIAYNFPSGSNNIVLMQCQAKNIFGSELGIGFYINLANSYFQDCLAINISNNQNSTFECLGYDIVSTSSTVLFKECIAKNISLASTAPLGTGFMIGGENIHLENCIAESAANVGININTGTAGNTYVNNCVTTYCSIGIDKGALSGNNNITNHLSCGNSFINYLGTVPFVIAQGAGALAGQNISVPV